MGFASLLFARFCVACLPLWVHDPDEALAFPSVIAPFDALWSESSLLQSELNIPNEVIFKRRNSHNLAEQCEIYTH